jgi:hypothetical protein
MCDDVDGPARRGGRTVSGVGSEVLASGNEGVLLMTIMMTELDLDTADSSLLASDTAERLIEWCSMMTRSLGVFAGIVPQGAPEAVPFELPPVLFG